MSDTDRQDGRNVVEGLGARVLSVLRYAGGMSLLLGNVVGATSRGLLPGRNRFRWGALSGQMVRVGIRSLPIVMLVQLFIGMILTLQLAPTLADYGQLGKIPTIIGMGGFRMLGPIITAVVISGFAGASIAAELGTMVVAEEIEAMRAMAMNPIRFLVVPRVLATLVVMVLLTVISDLVMCLGGFLACKWALGPDAYLGYWTTVRDEVTNIDFITGLVQAAVFGVLIGLIACYEGLNVRGGAEGVGRATTMTVVYSLIATIVSSGIFTVGFYLYQL
ncbi:MAG: ABC transporter permease [bacterium]|nr:ABC transporter permease [bacterium]